MATSQNYYDARSLNLDIDSRELKELYKAKPYINTIAFIVDWIIIFLCIYFCKQYFNPATYILAVIIIGARMHALGILMHESTHFRYFKSKSLSDFISNLFMAYPIFFTVESYRDNHLRHHQFLNTENDPDWVAKRDRRDFRFPQTTREYISRIMLFLAGYQGTYEFFWILGRLRKINSTIVTSTFSKITRLVYYTALVVVLSYYHLWLDFLLFWVIPFLTMFMLVQYIRSFSEHFGGLKYTNLFDSTRSIDTLPLEGFLISPYNINYHIEHHLYPAVPYYNLPKLRKLLMTQPEFIEKAHLTKGYMWGFIRDLTGRNSKVVQ